MISVNLKCVKAKYLNILEPSTGPLAFEITPKYSLSIVIPPTHKDLYLIRKAIILEGDFFNGAYKSPLKKDDSDLDNLSIFAKCTEQPLILNADGSIADIEQKVKGLVDNDYFDINIAMYKYSHGEFRGIACVLERIKFRNQ